MFEKYPNTGSFLPNSEARLVAAYRKAIDEYQSLVGVAAKYIVPTMVGDKIVPGFDDSKIEEVHQLYDQRGALQQHDSPMMASRKTSWTQRTRPT